MAPHPVTGTPTCQNPNTYTIDDGKLYGAGQGTYLQNGSLASVNEPFEILALSGKKFNRMAMGNCHGFAYYAPSTSKALRLIVCWFEGI
jgi:hypothetical protein